MSNATKLKLAHIISIVVSIVLPVTAVFQKMRVSVGEINKVKALSIGAILVIFILAVTLRKMLWQWLKEWIGAVTMPPIIMWIIFLAIVVGLQSVADALTKYLPAFRTICIAGLIGAGIGCVIDASSNMLWNKQPKELH